MDERGRPKLDGRAVDRRADAAERILALLRDGARPEPGAEPGGSVCHSRRVADAPPLAVDVVDRPCGVQERAGFGPAEDMLAAGAAERGPDVDEGNRKRPPIPLGAGVNQVSSSAAVGVGDRRG